MSPPAHVLDRLVSWLATYVKTGTPEDLHLLALWTAHTHLMGQLSTTPRLLITSPLPGSGKTTALEHLHALCGGSPILSGNSLSASVAARAANAGWTLLIDEADKHIGNGKADQRALLSIVNSGYKQSGTYLVNEPDPSGSGGWVPVALPVFAPVAMAGIATSLPDDTMSRLVRVVLLPDTTGAVSESDWEAIQSGADALRGDLAAWAHGVQLQAGESLPDGVVGRLREVWRPLKRVAVAAAGHWPDRADTLARHHLESTVLEREAGLLAERPHVAILRDLYGVWHLADPRGVGYVATADLLDALHRHAPTQWGSAQPDGRRALTPTGLGRMLVRAYGIHSDRIQVDGARQRGYRVEQFRDAWHAVGLAQDELTTSLSIIA